MLWEDVLNPKDATSVREQSSPFFRLPLEIREIIFDFALLDAPNDLSITGLYPWRLFKYLLDDLPPFTRSSRQMLLESSIAQLRRITFQLGLCFKEDALTMLDFLAQFPRDQGLCSVRSVEFVGSETPDATAHVKLISACTGLKELIINASDMDLWILGWQDDERNHLVVEEMDGPYPIASLLQVCSHTLNRVMIKCNDEGWNYVPKGRCGVENLDANLMKLLRRRGYDRVGISLEYEALGPGE